MKVIYHNDTDTLTIIFSDGTVDESDEERQGIIMDYDKYGSLLSIEILDASQKVMLPNQIEYQVLPSVINKRNIGAYI